MSVTAVGSQTPKGSAWAATWALLVGMGLLMLGTGLQGSLLGVRAEYEGFPNFAIGIIMAGFYIGMLAGALWAPEMIKRVGHIRVFAAFASLASTAVLLHGVFVDPYSWALFRLITGFCFAGIFVVTESWLNDSVDNASRGTMFAFYTVVCQAGLGGGQLLLNVGDFSALDLFVLVSVLLSVAVVPLLLSASRAPSPDSPTPVTLFRLYKASPTGVAAVFFGGLVIGAVLSLGVVFAGAVGLDLKDASFFMLAVVTGAALFQMPIGRLSDKFDRRHIIMGCAAGLVVTSVWVAMVGGSDLTMLLLAAACCGGVTFSLYPLGIAYSNDFLEPTELVGASGGLIVIYGAGSVLGPLLGGVAMDVAGPSGVFWMMAVVAGILTLFILWRMGQSSGLAADEQGPWMPMPATAQAVVIEAVEEVHYEEVQASDRDIDWDEAELEARMTPDPEAEDEPDQRAAG